LAPSFVGLPPTLVMYGGRELLAPQIRTLIGRLRGDGVAVTSISDSHMSHCYPLLGELLGASGWQGLRMWCEWNNLTLKDARKTQAALFTRNRFSTTNFA
jgi:acetyl esterase/lipase